MKRHVTNLGGIVNKDMAFSKASQDVVYDSQNFRITANDDGTLAVRTNVKGNTNVVQIPTTQAQWKLQLTDTSFLVAGYQYTIELDGENLINDIIGGFTWTFTFNNTPQFYQDLAAAINTESSNINSFLYGSTASVSPTFDYIEITGPLTFLTVLTFVQTFPVTGELITNGTFNTNPIATWIYGPAWTWDNVNVEIDATLASGDILQQSGLAFLPGQIYTLQFTTTVTSGSFLALTGYGSPNQWSSPLINTSGTYTYTFTYSSSVGFENITFFPNNFTGSIDNVSIQVPDYASYLSIVQEIPILTNLRIIGWTTLRDDIILITTNGTFNPDDPTTGPFTSYGQLWRLSYDKGGNLASSTNYNLTLLYNKQLNLTIHRPIANPGMIEARYESSIITPVYWTDNYNPPRRANVADPTLATYDPERLNLLPSLDMTEPKLKEIVQQGNLKTGVYQFAYRLKNINGAETKFSRPSKLIPIIDASELGQYINYYPQSVFDPLTNTTSTVPGATGDNIGGDANKSVRLLFENLDTNYDTIEIVGIYYADNVTFPEAYIFKIDAVPVSGNYETIVDSTSSDIPITIDELTTFNSTLIRCKTLATKAQTLFLGNISISDREVGFDARTYRFPKNFSYTKIKNNNIEYRLNSNFQISQVGPNPVVPYDVPEEHDCVQDYDMQAPDSHQNCLYIPNSNVLGGEGPSIKYTFITEDMVLDEENNIGLPPYKNVSPATFDITNINGGTIEHVSTFKDNDSPYLYDALVGYRRDEMERFGIVFFDEYDNPSYVKWIADIRFPHQFMSDPTATGLPRTMYTAANYQPILPEGDINVPGGDKFVSTVASINPVSGGPESELAGNILGLRITIKNYDGLPARFIKAGIVRVPKQPEDRHIIGQGFLRPTYKSIGSPNSDDWVFTASSDGTGISNSALVNTSSYAIWSAYHTFVSPEFLFKSLDNLDFTQGDKLDIIGIYRKTTLNDPTAGTGALFSWLTATSGILAQQTGNGDNDEFTGIVTKNYFIEETASTPYPVKNPLSNNPYPLTYTRSIPNKFLQNGGFVSTTVEAAYQTGNTYLQTGQPIRQLFNSGIKNLQNINWFPNNPTTTTDVFSHCNESLFVQIETSASDNFNATNFGGQNFLENDRMPYDTFTSSSLDWATGMNGYMANYTREVPSQFGGNSYSQRSFSEYISTGCIIDISDRNSTVTTKVFGGDTTVTVMDYMMQFIDQSIMNRYSGGSLSVLAWMCLFPCETSVAVNLRRSYKNNTLGKNIMVPNRSKLVGAYNENDSIWTDDRRPYIIDFAEYFLVDKVYNYSDKHYIKFFPKPYLTIPITEFDCRVWRSERKIDASLVDTWGIYKPSAYLDVESKYGPLNNLIVFKDKLLYFQDKAFGQLQVAEQKLINSASGGTELVLGSSGILERYDYISTQTGTKHQFSMSVSDYSLLWFDTLARKIYKLGDGLSPVTDLKGYHAYLYTNTAGEIQNNDNPYLNKGVHSTYDYRFNEFYMTFLSEDKQFTLVYNDMFEGFVGEYTHYPVVYINDKSNIFSVPYSPLASRIWIHNYGNYCSFYGNNPEPSKISFLVNPAPTEEKVFTNMEMLVESFKTTLGYEEPDFYDFFDTMRVYDNYQNTDTLSLVNFATKHKTIWDIKVPSDRVLDVTQPIFDAANLSTVRPPLTRRMKDKWFMVDMVYNNTDNNKLVVHYNTAIYMPNSR